VHTSVQNFVIAYKA